MLRTSQSLIQVFTQKTEIRRGMESIQQILYGLASDVLGTPHCVTTSNKNHLIL